MEKPILIGSAAVVALAPNMRPVRSVRPAAINERRSIVLEPIGFAPWESVSVLSSLPSFQSSRPALRAATRAIADQSLSASPLAMASMNASRSTLAKGQRHVRLLACLQRKAHVLHAQHEIE